MRVVILSGGNGSRLWPLSRTHYPKQFVNLVGKNSLFQEAILRNTPLASSVTVSVNQQHYFLAADQVEDLALPTDVSFILEPVGKNTAPALALAALWSEPEEIILAVPSDHVILNTAAYGNAVARASDLARQEKIVTFGVVPVSAETGYGYIKTDGEEVLAFKEKPDLVTAQEYFSSGNYLWNSGMFCFRAKVFLEKLKLHSPQLYQQCSITYENAKKGVNLRPRLEDMSLIGSESIDYALLEKASDMAVVHANFQWSDLGSFDSLRDFFPTDLQGNTKAPNIINLNSKNNFILGQSRLITTIDVEDLMIIETPDAMLVTKKGSSQRVRELVTEVNRSNSDLTTQHPKAHTPWGTYTVLLNDVGHKVKKLVVRPQARLSLQYHNHRSEHWIVVSGTATVTVDDKTFELNSNESTFVAKGVTHRIENFQKVDLVIIETQIGDHVHEDDIVRVEDDYFRN
ncbi:MAG TPA: mannose-1-phosphate guanylyltransferase/mannose-6-phosphate isomerase [Bacteriovoracaceae bacterium]|nr:mannose-1-phosphate guanylyltransferase/mannose-6-phosphate isomerase [Bacteriovoracaceae bacterium]